MTNTIHTAGQKALSEALAAARTKAGLTQAALGKILRCHQSMIARIESGQRRIDVVELVIICRGLDVDPSDILAVVAAEVSLSQGL